MKYFILFLCGFSLPVGAVSVIDILKAPDHSLSLQKELKTDIGSLFPVSERPEAFIKAFEAKDFKKSLKLWLEIQSSNPTGTALYAYLLFKNGFEVLSLKKLLEIKSPEKIHPIVRKVWAEGIDKKHPVWDRFFFPISKKWHGFFPAEVIFKFSSKSSLKINRDQEYVKSLLTLPFDSHIDLFPLEWFFVLSLIHQKDMDSATKILAFLIKKTKDQNKRDKIHLTIARLLAHIGETSAALNYYDKIKTLSYFWLLAQEEKAWIIIKNRDYNKAYSTAGVFDYGPFKKEADPYMLLVLTLSQLKNCDYKGAVRSLFDFKDLFSKRKTEIDKILSEGSYDALTKKLLAFYKSKTPYYKVSSSDLFYRLRGDHFLKNHILLSRYIKDRAFLRGKGFQSLKDQENQIAYQIESRVKNRIQVLLKEELEKIESVRQKMHIVEAELLYRVHGFHALLPGRRLSQEKSLSFSPSSGNVMYFPYNPSEIWLDELSHYQSWRKVQDCPSTRYRLSAGQEYF